MNKPAPGTISPADGSQLDPVRPTSEQDIAEVVHRAREAQKRWARRTLSDRADALERVVRRILEQADDVAALVRTEAGKSTTDTKMNEIAPLGAYLQPAVREAKAALAPVKVKLSSLEYPGKRATIEQLPRGVIGIIAPWNYPLANFFKPMFPALLAGNAVVIKPSEYTPRTGAWLHQQFEAELPTGLVGLVQGGGSVGATLLESGIDAVTFTGSVPTGKKVAKRAAELLIPCSVELGGKDAAIVLADCDMERTVLGIAQWALHNTGQNCAAVERVYVEEAIADEFVERLGRVVSKLRVAPEEYADIGPLQNEAQLDIVERHVADALEKGATLVTGGERTGEGLGYCPTVLDECDEEMEVMTDETFGPVVAIRRVREAEEALRLANDSPYGLNGSVWTTNIARGTDLAKRLEVGIALVNNHAFTGSMSHIPWTGVKDTGPGVAGSRFSYHTFTRPRTIFIDSGSKPDPWWFPVNEDLEEMANLLIARGLGSFAATIKLATMLGKRVAAMKKLLEK
jgi:acyl-CoA reductase-like NAD-dependent aldehyde dehydrogenase